MGKYCIAGQATDYNTAHAYCMLHTQGHKYTHTHTHRLCNTQGFSTTTMVARTCLDVTLYVVCLSCSTLHRIVLSNIQLKRLTDISHSFTSALFVNTWKIRFIFFVTSHNSFCNSNCQQRPVY